MESKRTAIITGGGSGIGFAITSRFVKAGIRTIIIGRDAHKLASTQQELGDNCHPITHDLNDLSSLPDLVRRIEIIRIVEGVRIGDIQQILPAG